MKLPFSLSGGIASLLFIGNLAGDVFANKLDPSADLVRQKSHGRKAQMRSLYGRANQHTPDHRIPHRRQYVSPCEDTSPQQINAPKENVWYGLTDDETAAVARWLFARPELNLTASENAGEWDNTIVLIELNRPNKTESIPYLEGNGPAPTRYAHVRLNNRATVDLYYADILVGPLPVSNISTWQPLEFPYTRKTQGQVRNVEPDGETVYSEWLFKISASIADITLDLWNGTALGLENDTLDIWGIDPLWQDGGWIVRWGMFWNSATNQFDSGTPLPLGLYLKSDVTGRDPSQWELLGWMCNDIFYETTEEFREAYWSPGFVKLGPNLDGAWAHTDQRGTIPSKDRKKPPLAVAPDGARYSVDTERKYVSWMDFSFYIGFNRDTGLSLFDIKRHLHITYAGNDPVQSSVAYLDSYYGFGPYAFELLKGYDCPSYASYLNTSFYNLEETHTHVDSLCLFEFDADYPLSRRSTSESVSVTKNDYFTLCTVSTIGNYDYMFSYNFHMDGTIGVEVRASGYIQSAYYANNQDFGYQVHDSLSGSMHDHVLNFKADFDILGTDNTIELTSLVPVERQFSWNGNRSRNTMQLDRSIIESKEPAKNRYGENRGYRILPSSGTAHLTVQTSSNLAHAAHWAEYDVQVAQQHDSEPFAVHPYNSQDIHDPPVDFRKFFNGESLNQTDLVVWLNLGMHHAIIQFMPLNYLLGDPSRETVNMVRSNETCAVRLSPTEDELWSYQGDVIVRKFPYDFNEFYETE
ncbi:copper amine oxidase [Aspergillus aurantiobrunneus]